MKIRHLILLFAPFAFASPLESQEPSVEDAVASTADSQPQEETSEEEDSGYYNRYEYNGRIYYSSNPVTVEHHLERTAEDLGRQFHWLFEYSWSARTKKEKLRHLSPSDEEYETLKNRISDDYQYLNHLSNCHYESARFSSLEYVEPEHMPKELSWRLGILLGLYGNILKATALWNPNQPLENFELTPAENAKVLAYYKISLLFFSYYLGLSEKISCNHSACLS